MSQPLEGLMVLEGWHTRALLQEAGYLEPEILELEAKGITVSSN